jgi:hypothetical protein
MDTAAAIGSVVTAPRPMRAGSAERTDEAGSGSDGVGTTERVLDADGVGM